MPPWASRLVIGFLIFFFIFVVVRRTILTNVARLIIGRTTHFKVELGHFDINPFLGALSVKDVKFYNPPEFGSGLFLDLKEVYIDLNIIDFFTRRMIHVQKLKLNLNEITVVRNAQGKVNLTTLTPVSSSQHEQPRTMKQKTPAREEKMPFLIDELYLTMRKVNYLDYSKNPTEPKKYGFDMKVNETVMKNVTNPAAIMGTIVLEIAYHTTIGNLGIDLKGLKRQVESSLANTETLTREGLDYIRAKKDAFESPEGKKFLQSAEKNANQFVEEANQIVGDAAKDLKNFFK